MWFIRRAKAKWHGAAPWRSFVPRLEILEDRTVPSTLTVLNNLDSGAGSLRDAITAAQSGDQIVFDQSLQGQTITLTSGELAIAKSLDIEGPRADQLAISGNHASRVFNVSSGATVTIAGLTITNGLAVGGPGAGGGIENIDSNLTVANAILSNNEALGSGGNGNGRGGAIDSMSGATLTVTHSLFIHNQAIGSNAALAGAINTQGSAATVSDSTFLGNQSIGGSGGNNGFSRGGAIYNLNGTLTVANCTFTGNQAIAGSGNTGGDSTLAGAFGGGIANTDLGILFVTGSVFSGNQSLGGSNNTRTGGTGNVGVATGGGLMNVGVATVTDSTFEDNEARGGSGNRGDGTSFQFVGTALGGAISTKAGNTSGTPVSLTIEHVTLRGNRALGGDGNTAGTFLGTAWGGGLESDDLLLAGPPGQHDHGQREYVHR
jgi:hypothetical protein